ncbi:hypothetical protein B0H14DRAFT_3494186 [Mycena olivaceomarginata]|nr:hypothetical protein B0H14DRAFT_3494186 [Mycena olivaceomarginata]
MADDDVYEISDSESVNDGVADNDVDGMIRQMVAKNPECSKWTVMSPELMRQKEKQRKAKEKRDAKKRKRQDDDDNVPKSAKKGKQKEEDEVGYPIVSITGYIHVMKPTLALPSRSCVKPTPETLYISRGPFLFMSDCSFAEFVVIMSKALPFSPDHIVLDKTDWKLQTPANRSPLPRMRYCP